MFFKTVNYLISRAPWGPFKILEPSLRLFSLKLGPSGGLRGYEGITGWSNARAVFTQWNAYEICLLV